MAKMSHPGTAPPAGRRRFSFTLVVLLTLIGACALIAALRSGAPALPPGAATVTPAWRTTASTVGPGNPLGRSMFALASDGLIQNESPRTLARDLASDEGTGAKWLRIDINWAQIQAGGSKSYAWTSIDRLVTAAQAHGMSVLGVLIYTPAWAAAKRSCRQPDCAPSPRAFAKFAKAAVAHYAKLGVNAYELWSEENSTAQWLPRPDPAAYAQLLKDAYPLIKRVDRAATVITGGTSPSPTNGTGYSPPDFLSALYADGAQHYFDAVGAHPYCWPAYPGQAESWSAWYQMYGAANSMRNIMVAHGDAAKRIWGTEFGVATYGPTGTYMTPATQAQMIYDGYKLWSTYSWAGPLFLYDGRDQMADTHSQTVWNFLGLTYHNFTKKPAYFAYQQAVRHF